MKSNSVRNLVLMATAASGLVASVAPAAQASEASTREAQVGNTAQATPQSVVNVASNIVVDVARTPSLGMAGPRAASAPAASTNYNNGGDSYQNEWAAKAASNGWTYYWYIDGNGTKHEFNTGGGSTSTGGNTGGSTTGGSTSTGGNTGGSTTGGSTSGSGASTDTTGGSTSGKASSIASTASSYLGRVRYSFGDTPSGWNCAGFASYVFNQNGIALPWRNPDIQAQWLVSNGGRYVSTPQAGDFVYQENGGTGSMHAGIYAGNGMMYAAVNSDYGTYLQPVSWGWGTHYVRV